MPLSKQARWKHFSMLGHLTRAEQFVQTVQQLPTATSAAKSNAREIEELLWHLRVELKEMSGAKAE